MKIKKKFDKFESLTKEERDKIKAIGEKAREDFLVALNKFNQISKK